MAAKWLWTVTGNFLSKAQNVVTCMVQLYAQHFDTFVLFHSEYQQWFSKNSMCKLP